MEQGNRVRVKKNPNNTGIIEEIKYIWAFVKWDNPALNGGVPVTGNSLISLEEIPKIRKSQTGYPMRDSDW